MALSRMELEVKGAGSPDGLVKRILELAPDLPLATPIEALCEQLDISDIRELTTGGFEGGLITDTDRSDGVILVNKKSHYFRQRFTMAHELAHFLLPTHMSDEAGRFLCSREDLNLLTANESDRRARMEVEANRFASLILIRPPVLRKAFGKREPSLAHMIELSETFEVSKQAMARAYADYHAEAMAIIGVKDGRIISIATNRTRFPYIQPRIGAAVPDGSLFHRDDHRMHVASDFTETLPDHWVEVRRGEAAPVIFEQIYRQRDGYGLILLHLELPEEDEDEEHNAASEWGPKFWR